MQLENIATPQEDSTPQLRYASLHRTVERGMASDDVLRELVEICLQLGHTDEAVRVHATMKAGAARDHVGALLARRGLIARAPDPRTADDMDVEESGEPSIAEHALDAVQYLCQGHMPAVALLTMLAFPIVVGVGGFLTSGGSPWLFAGLATLPGLCVLGVVGAMGRQIFLQSAEGEEEIPAIPAPAEMVRAAKRYLTDVLIVLGAYVAPSLTLLWFSAPLVSSLPGLVIGMFLTPIALILRQIRGDFGALSPVALVRGIGCCSGYFRVAATFWAAFGPAALAFWQSLGHAVWLQIAIVGPLAVLPMFGTARLLGTFTELHRTRLGLLLYPSGQVSKPAATPGSKPAAPSAPTHPKKAQIGKPQFGRRMTQRQHTHTPLQHRKHEAPATGALGNMLTQFSAPAAPQFGEPRAAQFDAPAPKAAAPAAPPAPKAPAPRAPARPPAKAPPRPAPAPAPAATPPAKLPPKPSHLARKAEDSTPQPGNLARRPSPEDWMVDKPKKAQLPAHIEGRAPKAPAKSTQQPMALAPANELVVSDQDVDDKGLGGPDLSNLPGATIIHSEDRERLGASSRKQ